MATYDIIAELGDAQTFTTLTTTEAVASTDALDLGEGLEDLNFGSAELWLNISIATAFVGGSQLVELKSSTNETITAGDTAVITVPTQALSSLEVGDYVFRGRIPLNTDTERYIGVLVTNSSTPTTAGALDIWIEGSTQTDHPSQKAQSNIT